jgi:hypothetical protein
MDQEQLFLSIAVKAMINRVSYMRGYTDISSIDHVYLYRVTNISEDCVMIEYFNQDKYNILYIPAVERDGTPLNERCIKPRPFKKIPLTGSVEHKIMALCHEVDVIPVDINNLKQNMYYGACGYLKLNNIDSTLNKTYKFDDHKLTIVDESSKTTYFF